MRGKSRPVRARGLKHATRLLKAGGIMSRPVRARGLKLIKQAGVMLGDKVAPRAGAWIETLPVKYGRYPLASRAPCGRVD